MIRRALSPQMQALVVYLALGPLPVTGRFLASARALRARRIATRVRVLRPELSLSGHPLRREEWRLTAAGRRAFAERPVLTNTGVLR